LSSRAQLGSQGEWVRVADVQTLASALFARRRLYFGIAETHRALDRQALPRGGARHFRSTIAGAGISFPGGLARCGRCLPILIAKSIPAESIMLAGDGAGEGRLPL